uniref:ATP synthase CF1 delta subunit n=1 Tax=Neogoniolithon spectabile TaxID=231755 RepID=A0A3G3MH09_9FLOR|nr:ATP synthase CF1 delta subunit [Neogoniolithon spectabile]AYR06082.1 ATP synthase CF1 delta subunit [Neogoniolithon spectabile]
MSTKGLLKKIALPYAEALFDFSKSKEILESINQDLKFILDTLLKTDTLVIFLTNPLVKSQCKINVIKAIFTSKISKYALDFLYILIEKRRINLLNLIIDEYFNLFYSLEAVTIVDLYSAIVISSTQQKALEEKLITITKSRQIKLLVHIKPELIAGVIVKIGSKVIDMSIYGQLKQVESYLNCSTI